MDGKKIIVVVVAIVVIVILVYYVEFMGKPKSVYTTQTTVRTKNMTLNTTTLPPTTYILPTTVNSTTSCIRSGNTTLLNGNFGTGTYAQWNVTGTGFGTRPNNTNALNSNDSYTAAPWTGLNAGDYFATTYKPGLANIEPGNLTSDQFQVVSPYLNFKLISPQNAGLYITIIKNNKSVFVTHFNTYNASSNNPDAPTTFVNASIPIAQFLCDNVSVRVVGTVVGTLATRNQYIAVSEFYQSNKQATTAGIFVNHTST